jgi:transcriptional regulator with XRE-family HTH domain
MGKLSAGFDLGADLRSHRKTAGLTQPDLASKAGLAVRTVRALEQGSGTLDSWDAALNALGLVLSGRNLPGGETTGKRLATLRRRRGLSQEALARSVGDTTGAESERPPSTTLPGPIWPVVRGSGVAGFRTSRTVGSPGANGGASPLTPRSMGS